MADQSEARAFKDAWIAHVEAFQDAFLQYFPRLADFERAAIEAAWLESRVFGNPIQTVRRAEALKEVGRLRALLKELVAIRGCASAALWEHCAATHWPPE